MVRSTAGRDHSHKNGRVVESIETDRYVISNTISARELGISHVKGIIHTHGAT